MKMPCEVTAKDIVPTIKSAVVSILYDEYDLTQTEIAERMGITQASVSQYVQKTRGKNTEVLERVPGIDKRLRTIAERIFHNHEYSAALCGLCRDIRSLEESR